MSFQLDKVKAYWLQNLPALSQDLQQKGELDSYLQKVIDNAEDWLAKMVEQGAALDSALEVVNPSVYPPSEQEVEQDEADWEEGPSEEDDEAFDYDSGEETVAFVGGDRGLPVVVLVDKHGRAKLK
jgi:hypothetical protein